MTAEIETRTTRSQPETPPAPTHDVRGELCASYLRGSGVEIGALHLAAALPPGAHARYVDRMGVDDLRAHYPELRDWDLAPVDIVDDGERLLTIAPESVDFIVANHFLEHCEDPIRTIETHLGKLRPGGVLFYAVPDKRFTFDFRRERTPLQHHIDDHEHGPERSRSEHYLQWATFVRNDGTDPPSPEQAQEIARRLEAENYSIHFHVWTESDLVALMLHIQERLGNFEIEVVRRHGIENIVVLRKHGTPAPAEQGGAPSRDRIPLDVAADPAAPRTERVPLSALRSRLDAAALSAEWQIDPDGVTGRALAIPSGGAVTFPLRLAEPVTFTAVARLLPHDWRDGTGAIRARLTITEPDGERVLWAGTLASSGNWGLPEGHEVSCELPASATSLTLAIDGQPPRERGLARALWVAPALLTAAMAPAQAEEMAPQPAAGAPTSRHSASAAGGERPLFSVLTPVHDPSPEMLRQVADSVLAQSCGDWELCLVDDGSRKPEIIALLDELADGDPRIRLDRRDQAGGIADATNAALRMARGEYVALLDHDDWLGTDALAQVAARIDADPNLDMVYTDEDIVLDGTPVWVHLKPGWSPDTLRTNGYTCHLGVYRRSLVQEIGGFRSEFNGSQDVDMILRLIERTDRVAHVPGIHYHWRIHPDSTAGGDAKPYAYVAARNAIAEHLERVGIDARVDYGPPGLYRVVHRVSEHTRCTLVLGLEDSSGVAEAAASWPAQTHPSWQVLLTGPLPVLEEATAALRAAGVANHRIRGLVSDPAEDRHAALARAAACAETEQLVLLQTPALGLTADWLARLLGYACQADIAAAGPILLAPTGQVADGGVAFPDGMPLPLLHGLRTSMDAHFGYGTSVYNVAAVSGVLATSRTSLQRAGGLRGEFAELMLVDYCLRAGAAGQRTVLVPDARLQLTGHDRTMNDLPRVRALLREHGTHARADPFYNPLFRADRGDFSPR